MNQARADSRPLSSISDFDMEESDAASDQPSLLSAPVPHPRQRKIKYSEMVHDELELSKSSALGSKRSVGACRAQPHHVHIASVAALFVLSHSRL